MRGPINVKFVLECIFMQYKTIKLKHKTHTALLNFVIIAEDNLLLYT